MRNRCPALLDAALRERQGHAVTQMVEVVRLAEELREIGRDRVDEALDLLLPSAELRYSRWVAKRGHAQGAQPPRERLYDQVARLLSDSEIPAWSLARQRDEAAKIRVGKLKFAAIGAHPDQTRVQLVLVS